MLELAASGARVLALRSVEYARNHGVKIHVRSSFNESEGTWVDQGGGHGTGDHLGRRPRHERGEGDDPRACPTGRASPGARSAPLAEAGINIGEIVQNTSIDGLADISFTLPENELERAEPILEQLAEAIGAEGFTSERDIAKVSVIGAGMKSNPGVAAAIFEALADAEDQHRDHLDLVDPRLLRRPGRRLRPRRNVIHERLKLADVFYEDGADGRPAAYTVRAQPPCARGPRAAGAEVGCRPRRRAACRP